MQKPSFYWNSRGTIYSNVGGEVMVKVISLKVNRIERHEFELAYYDITVLHVSYNATWISDPNLIWVLYVYDSVSEMFW